MKVLFMIWSGHGFEPGQVELGVRSTFKVVIFISGLSIPGLNKISNARGVTHIPVDRSYTQLYLTHHKIIRNLMHFCYAQSTAN